MRTQLLNWLKEMNANYPSGDTEYNEALAQKRKEHLVTKILPGKEAERLRFLSADFDPKNNWWGSKVTKD